MLRDFTDAEREKLLGFVDADQQKNDGRILGGLTDFFADGINYGDLDISDYLGNLDAYHQKLIDKNDMARDDITNLFDAVHLVDDNYKAMFTDKLNLLKAYDTSLVGLKNLISINAYNPASSNIYLPPIDFLEKSAGSTQALSAYYVDKYTIQNEDGTTTYDWEAIDATLNNDASDISEMEYCVLAYLYADMSNEDATAFLQCLADKIEDVDYALYQQIFQQHSPSEYTTWGYDTDKISHLSFYVNYEANVCAQYMYLIKSGTPEQLAQMFPDMSPDEFTDEFIRSFCIQYDDTRRDLLQRSSLLNLCGSLGASAFGTDNETNWFTFTYTYEGGDLTGEKGAIGPKITLSEGENGYLNMTFCNSQSMIYPNTSSSGISSNSFTDHLSENSITISYVGSNNDSAKIINEGSNTYYSAQFAFNPLNVAAGDLQNFAIGQTRDLALTGVTAAPVIGLVMDGAINLAKAYDESQQRLEDVMNTYDSMDVALYYSDLHIDAAVINDGTSENVVIGYPTYETQLIVNNINKHISPPITIEDVMQNPKKVNDTLEGLGPSIRSQVLDPYFGEE